MARYRMKDPELWLPGFAKGKNLPALKIRYPKKDGKKVEIAVPVGEQHGGFEFDVTDEHAIRCFDVDPRYDRIS